MVGAMPVPITTSSRISVTQSTGAVVARTRATSSRLLASTTTPPMTRTAASVPAAAENQR
jgi:hypothetical protein